VTGLPEARSKIEKNPKTAKKLPFFTLFKSKKKKKPLKKP
jgi:hypothetical protein